MATRKTSGSKPGGTTKKTSTTRRKAPVKSEPVILDPPEPAKKPEPQKKPEVIDAKATEVKTASSDEAKTEKQTGADTKSEPKPKSEDPKPKAPNAASEPRKEPQKPEATKSRGGFIPLLFGGLIAGGIGYGVSEYQKTTAVVIDQSPLEHQIEALENRILTLEQALANSSTLTLEEDIAALKQALADQLTVLNARISSSEEALQSALLAMENLRQDAGETLSEGGTALGSAGQELLQRLQAEVDALKTRLSEQEDLRQQLSGRLDDLSAVATEKLDAARTEAANLAEKATRLQESVNRDVVLQKLEAAVETGQSYAALLAEAASNLGTEPPGELTANAETGIATLAALQADFPKAARAGLRASIRATAGDSAGEKLEAFIRAQIGARSLEPREGDDPDAKLSRAEHALKAGDLAVATQLVKSLPPEGITAMKGWLTRAEQRLAAQSAFDAFVGGTGQ